MKAMNPVAAVCPYLVGDLYFTERAGNPSQSWPGTTWEQITDCFIRAADADHPAGRTGGSWTHTQTTAEMAAHTHAFLPLNSPIVDTGAYDAQFGLHFTEGTAAYRAAPGSMGNTGSGQPMDITNKFRAAYVWKRTG